jgi:aspartyl/asparaginyl beta-hydroxylase (cupin superfamily)/Flp pilus assembly protein TadD
VRSYFFDIAFKKLAIDDRFGHARGVSYYNKRHISPVSKGIFAVVSLTDSVNAPEERLAEARRLIETGQPRSSLTMLRELVDRFPGSAEAHNHLGAALQGVGSNEDALKHHEAALALSPEFADAHMLRARALQGLGRHSEAVAAFEHLLSNEPSIAPAQFWLGSALEELGRYEEAFVRYRNASALDARFAEALKKALAVDSQRRPELTQKGTNRLNLFVNSFIGNHANPRMGAYPGLRSEAFHDSTRLPGPLALERDFEAIRAELLALQASEFQEEAEGLKERGTWDVFLFYERGRKNVENCSRCPTIARVIESQNTVRTQAGLLYASKLNPGTHIKAHRGPTNLRLRCHLGIQIPTGDCGLKVDGETRHWQEGKCLVFDDSLEHEAWNYGSMPRIVLIIDFWHPDLTATEITFLEGLHRFADYHALVLNRYWSANANAKSKSRTHYD